MTLYQIAAGLFGLSIAGVALTAWAVSRARSVGKMKQAFIMVNQLEKSLSEALCKANQEIERLKVIIAERERRPPSKGMRTDGGWEKFSCPNLTGGWW